MIALPNRLAGQVFSMSLAVLALAGCAGGPTPAERTAPAVESAKTFAGPVADWPSDKWWAAYNDPQLTTLIEEALVQSPTLAQASARMRRSQALARQAGAANLPSLSLEGGVQEVKQSYNTGIPPEFLPQGYNDVGRLNLDFSWELDFWGRNRAAIAAASSEARAASADAAEARLALSTSVASAYADLAALYRARTVAERTIAVREQTLDLAQQRVDNGLDTQAELNQAKAGPPSARADLKAIDEQITITRNRLAALIGAGPDRGQAIAPPGEARLATVGLPQSLAADLIGRRPDVIAARWRAEASRSRIKEAKAAFYPNINLTAAIGYQSLFVDRLFDGGSDYGSVGPAISLPLFQGGRLKGGLDAAVAGRDEAIASYDAVVLNAFEDVANVVASQRALDGRLSDSQEALSASEAAYQVTRTRYEGGLTNFQAVLISEQQVLTQRRIVADLESRRFSLDIALVRALGGGFNGDSQIPQAARP
jgi:NodT family efflux transporter outer membrane factor (OMF) lipoprotein